MPKTVSSDVRQQIYSPEMRFVPLCILDIEHESIDPEVIRVVNNNVDIVYNTNTYQACSFSITLPVEEDATVEPAKLSISNIDRRMVSLIRSTSGLINVTLNIVMVTDDDIELEQGPLYLYLSNVSYNSKTITGALTNGFRHDQYLSTVKNTVRAFPSIIGG